MLDDVLTRDEGTDNGADEAAAAWVMDEVTRSPPKGAAVDDDVVKGATFPVIRFNWLSLLASSDTSL